MENNDTTNDESLDSIPQPSYEALEDEEKRLYNSIKQNMQAGDNYNMFVEEQKYKKEYDLEREIDIVSKGPSTSSISQNHATESGIVGLRGNRRSDEEDFALTYEEEEELCREYEYDEEGSQSDVEHITPDKKNDTLIVKSNDGMIKKIKVCNSSREVGENRADIKGSKLQNEGNGNKVQPRSITPLSREYLALQRSVNESKILTEFVTKTGNEKPRKLRAKDSSNSHGTDHSYSSYKKSSQPTTEKMNAFRKSLQSTPEKMNADDSFNNTNTSQSKRQHNKRFAALKDVDSDLDSSSNLRPRSRSKSVHSSEFYLSGSHKKLKKWPSEERLHKRTNMRSENSEFAQKQMEFLQRVIHATEPSRSRSRSRSCGRKTPNSLNEQSFGSSGGGGSGVVGQQQKSNSKERNNSKRSKYDMSLENDDQHLGETASDHQDDESIYESQASMSVKSLGDTTLGESDELEAYLKSVWKPSPKPGYDSFCWKCHENKVNLCCCKCIRSFHAACVKMNKFDSIWLCPECTTIENNLKNPKRSRRNDLSMDLLSQLLSFALKRMRYTKGHYNFVMPYEKSPNYKKYIVNPVTLGGLQAKIDIKEFRCAEDFVSETKWMLHNACILSTRNNTKIIMAAKSIFKICRQEANEIETCAECYLNANTRTDWFVDVCSHPHLLLWAKLKGFPYWPAKAMGLGQNSLINVRFFGEHDRAFVPLKDCFLLSVQDPNTATGKRAAKELADCIKEVEEHVEKIKSKVGGFKYAPFKTPYDPADEIKQLAEMMPGVEDFIKKQQGMITKPSLQFKIYKTADNNLSIVHKASTTPELPSIAHDNDEKEKEKKKKLCSEPSESKLLEEPTNSTPKYEVVSKVSSDDSNSSKLSTVILKRKSVNGDSKRTNDDETLELPLPKMTKIDNPPVEEEANKLSSKHKLDNQSVEKSKAKIAKLELKIPIMTIKTSLTKELTSVNKNEANNKSALEPIANDKDEATEIQQTESNETASETQNVMESYVKHKQGVTIKKISKDRQNSNSAEPISLNTSKESQNQSSKDIKLDKQKSEDEKARENQKVNNILKGLVPFIEVKKEVLSDFEAEIEKQQNEKNTNKEICAQTTNAKEASLQKPANTSANNEQPTNNKKVDSNPTEKSTDKEDSNILLAQVKREVLSDEESESANLNITDSQSTKAPITPINSGSSAEKQKATTTNANDIRVVGDTTIQKVSKSQYLVQTTNLVPSNNNSNNSNNAKRSSFKGVPYGPLPASAFPKTITYNPFQPTVSDGIQQRAKKSFPQNSPPIEKLRSSNNQSSLTQMPTSSVSQHLDQKRTMAKNTMVAIPVDVAANRASTSAGTIIIGSIPVPPLTAVSKTVPSSIAHNSTARNSPATITVSGTSGSLTSPSVMVQTKSATSVSSTTSGTVRNSPITVTVPSSPLLAPLTSTSSSVLSVPVSTTTVNPLTLTTPPPLAGLSKSSLICTPQTNGVIDTNNATASSTPAAQQSCADTHILGGLVTPTLASAITDVICRGPPKLAARPSGPLQSEGYPMFPSQAGPVCKRLVENAHKLTDFFISVVEDTMGELAQGDDASLEAKTTLLTMELERTKQAHEQEIAELKRTSDLMLCEMRKSMENEKTRLVVEIRKQCEMDRLRSVEETKRKQWCANCFREANFYCCWNTSYCDYPCQQLHWSRHSHTCSQTRPAVNETTNTARTTTERHHNNKSNSTVTLSSTANLNKATTISQKKEKGGTKNSVSHMMSSSITTATPASASRTNTEVLKLPTNTYLRPVTSNLNNQTLRCNTTYSIPVQRFNAPMPITTPANSSSPQTYTIVQQGNSWVMSSTTNNNSNNNSSNSSATNSSTIAAPIANVPQVTGHARASAIGVGSITSNKSSKAQIRYH